LKRLYEPPAYATKVGSYWQTTEKPLTWPLLGNDIHANTVIIGGGYTGLCCALELANNGIDPASIVIVEAQQPGWGASGRNGGFCCLGGTKLSYAQQIAKFGLSETRNYFSIQKTSINSVQENLSRYDINADVHSSGETQLSYRPSGITELETEARHMRDLFDIECRVTHSQDMATQGLKSPEFFAALNNPLGFALNPYKYSIGLGKAAQDLGISVFGNSPATKIERDSAVYLVQTPKGSVRAENLVIATNGYSSEDIPDWLAGKLMPVLTNIITTRPLTPQELADQGWTSHQMCYDTRHSLHYFRLMPGINGEGPRMLFGMRGGTSASNKSHQDRHKKIRADFDRIFPAWRSVETPYFWSGLVCLTRDLTSYTGPIPQMPKAWASLAYHGNGVAMASYCGKQIAKMISHEILPESLPAQMRQTPRPFPFPALRLKYLKAVFKWYEWLDK
jgi:glycine/D-amino acid oxidase-like deaminating enzyme